MEDKKHTLKWLDFLFTLALGVAFIIAGILLARSQIVLLLPYGLIILGFSLLFLCGYNLWVLLKAKRGQK